MLFGHGYVTSYLARALVGLGHSVHISTRNPAKFNTIISLGAHPFVFGDPLPEATTAVVDSIPPVGGMPPALSLYPYAWPPGLRWVGYLSTTGVYADPPQPTTTPLTEAAPLLTDPTHRSYGRVTSEAAWQATGLPVHHFRLAGIYGPGRNMLQRVLEADYHGLGHDGRLVHRIHVADIVQVLLASLSHPTPGEAFNVCDDQPAPTYDALSYAAELLGKPVPAIAPGTKGAMSPTTNRHLSNAKIKQILGIKLHYPSYHSGLKQLLSTL